MTTDMEQVQWGSYELSALDEEDKYVAEASGSVLKLTPGRWVLRFLPPPAGGKSPFVITHKHFLQLPGMERMKTLCCPRIMRKRPCKVCKIVEAIYALGTSSDEELAYQNLAKLNGYGNVIVRSGPTAAVSAADGPQPLQFGPKIYERLRALRRDPDAGGDYTHPFEGFDIIITRQGTGKNDTKYEVMSAKKLSELGNMSWIEDQPDLYRYARIPEDEDIDEALAPAAAFIRKLARRRDARRPELAAQVVQSTDVSQGDDLSQEDAPF